VEFLIENPPCKDGQPPDILLKPALRAEKRPKIRVFSPRSGVAAACLNGRIHFFDDFSCFKFRLYSKSDRLLAACIRLRAKLFSRRSTASPMNGLESSPFHGRLGYSLNRFLIQRKQSIGKMDKWERLILNYDE